LKYGLKAFCEMMMLKLTIQKKGGQSLAKMTLLSKSSALPEARLAIVLALAGATH
jgi:hypothetical protein